MIEIGFDPSAVVAFVQAYPGRLRKAFESALERTAGLVQAAMIDLSTQRGIMRTVFRSNAGNAKTAIYGGKAETRGDTTARPIKLAGLARLQEVGGRTRPHLIRPLHGSYLVIGGKPIFAPKGVRHPGGNVRPFPFAERSAQPYETRLRSEVEAEVDKLNASAR